MTMKRSTLLTSLFAAGFVAAALGFAHPAAAQDAAMQDRAAPVQEGFIAPVEAPATDANHPVGEAAAEQEQTMAETPMETADEPAHDAAAQDAAAESHGEENVGFPQLDARSYPTQIFWLTICFILLYVLMSKLALPRVGAVLDMRQASKAENLNQADRMNSEAQNLKTAYEGVLGAAQDDAQKAITAAENTAAEKAAKDSADFSEKARARVLAAEAAINKARSEALASLSDISADVAADMVRKVSGLQIDKADAKKAVTTVMSKG